MLVDFLTVLVTIILSLGASQVGKMRLRCKRPSVIKKMLQVPISFENFNSFVVVCLVTSLEKNFIVNYVTKF